MIGLTRCRGARSVILLGQSLRRDLIAACSYFSATDLSVPEIRAKVEGAFVRMAAGNAGGGVQSLRGSQSLKCPASLSAASGGDLFD